MSSSGEVGAERASAFDELRGTLRAREEGDGVLAESRLRRRRAAYCVSRVEVGARITAARLVSQLRFNV